MVVWDGSTIASVDASKVASLFSATSNLLEWTDATHLTTVAEVVETDESGSMTFTVQISDGTFSFAFLGFR